MSLLGISLAFIAFAGIVANLIVLYGFGRSPRLRKRHLFVLNLSFMGLLLSLAYILACYYVFCGKDLIRYGCEIEAFTVSVLLLGSIFQLTAISIERCVVVWRPFFDKKILLSHKCIVVCANYLLSFAIASPPLFGWSRFKKVQQQFYCTVDFAGRDSSTRSYMTLLLISGYLLPILAISFSYLSIFILVRRSDYSHSRSATCENKSSTYPIRLHKRPLAPKKRAAGASMLENGNISLSVESMTAAPTGNSTQRLLSHERYRQIRIAVLMMVVCGTFIICWTPIAILSVIWPFFFETAPSSKLITLSAVWGKTFVVINPLIYGFSSNIFCAHFRFFKRHFWSASSVEKSISISTALHTFPAPSECRNSKFRQSS